VSKRWGLCNWGGEKEITLLVRWNTPQAGGGRMGDKRIAPWAPHPKKKKRETLLGGRSAEPEGGGGPPVVHFFKNNRELFGEGDFLPRCPTGSVHQTALKKERGKSPLEKGGIAANQVREGAGIG